LSFVIGHLLLGAEDEAIIFERFLWRGCSDPCRRRRRRGGCGCRRALALGWLLPRPPAAKGHLGHEPLGKLALVFLKICLRHGQGCVADFAHFGHSRLSIRDAVLSHHFFSAREYFRLGLRIGADRGEQPDVRLNGLLHPRRVAAGRFRMGGQQG
jgi:hypothetical protein